MVTDLERGSLTTICPGSLSMFLPETASVEGVFKRLVTGAVVATVVVSGATAAAEVEVGPGSDGVVARVVPDARSMLVVGASADGVGEPSNTTSSCAEQDTTNRTPTTSTAIVAGPTRGLPAGGRSSHDCTSVACGLWLAARPPSPGNPY